MEESGYFKRLVSRAENNGAEYHNLSPLWPSDLLIISLGLNEAGQQEGPGNAI